MLTKLLLAIEFLQRKTHKKHTTDRVVFCGLFYLHQNSQRGSWTEVMSMLTTIQSPYYCQMLKKIETYM